MFPRRQCPQVSKIFSVLSVTVPAACSDHRRGEQWVDGPVNQHRRHVSFCSGRSSPSGSRPRSRCAASAASPGRSVGRQRSDILDQLLGRLTGPMLRRLFRIADWDDPTQCRVYAEYRRFVSYVSGFLLSSHPARRVDSLPFDGAAVKRVAERNCAAHREAS